MTTASKSPVIRGLSLAIAACFFISSVIVPGQVVPPIETAETEQLVSLKFSNAPLDQILDFYSDLTARTIIKSPAANATITLRGKTRLTPVEALEAIESVLAMHNIALVPMGEKFLKVVQTATARREGMPLELNPPDEPRPETDQLISQIIDLKYIEISEAQPILDSLKHSYGLIQALERTNSLLVTDTAQNLKRMTEILEYLDRPITVKEDVFVREIVYTEASEIAARLQDLIAESQQNQDEGRARVAPRVPTRGGPPGVIRARQAASQPPPQVQAAQSAAEELAERGIIQGKVKIVADDRTGILFIISRPENFTFFDNIIDLLDRPIDPDFVVRVIAMEYADATQVAGILNDFIGAQSDEDGGTGRPGSGDDDPSQRSQALRDFARNVSSQRQEVKAAEGEASKFGRLSPSTKILADERTNALLLMGRKSDIAALREIIDQLDIMLGQVLIEAVILEVILDDDLSYGVDWLQRSFTVFNEEKIGPGGGLTAREPVAAFGGGQRVNTESPFIDAALVGRDTAVGSALTYYSTFFDLNIDAIIQMAASSSDARILSTPVVLTADNTEASINVGEQRPVVTTTSTTDSGTIRSAFEYQNIGITLTVTPRINPQRFVVMEVNQTANDVGGTVLIDGNEVPIITTREMSAQISVDNRETIILGGLVRTSDRKTVSKVPILGDIPILGALFRSESTGDERTELMVLITPYVLMTPEEVRAETERLHKSTQLDRTNWERGWSDSRLARPSKEDLKRQKAYEKKLKRSKKKKSRSKTIEGEGEMVPDIVIMEPTPTIDVRVGVNEESEEEKEMQSIFDDTPDTVDTIDLSYADNAEEALESQVEEEISPVDEEQSITPSMKTGIPELSDMPTQAEGAPGPSRAKPWAPPMDPTDLNEPVSW